MNHQAIYMLYPNVVRIDDSTGAYDANGKLVTINKVAVAKKQKELKGKYDAKAYARKRQQEYPKLTEFAEAYCEKEIGGDSTKWDAYIIKYNLVRSNNPKPKE